MSGVSIVELSTGLREQLKIYKNNMLNGRLNLFSRKLIVMQAHKDQNRQAAFYDLC